jgi:hypothetical protein
MTDQNNMNNDNCMIESFFTKNYSKKEKNNTTSTISLVVLFVSQLLQALLGV